MSTTPARRIQIKIRPPNKKKIKNTSAKAKGRSLQTFVRDLIIAYNPELTLEDVRSTSSGANGEDILMSPHARRKVPYSIECKSRRVLSIYGMFQQAIDNAKYAEPLLVVKQNRSRSLAVVDAEHFIKLVAGYKDLYEKLRMINIDKEKENNG